MPSLSAIAAFAARLLIAYAGLSALWLALGARYVRGYCGAMERLFGDFGGGRRVQFVAREGAHAWADVELRLGHAAQAGRYFVQEASSFLDGYLPVAAFLALVLATPRRSLRWGGVAVGLVAVHAFVLLRPLLVVTDAYASPGLPDGVRLELADGVRWLLHQAAEVAVGETTTTFLVAALAWMPAVLGRRRSPSPADAQPRQAT